MSPDLPSPSRRERGIRVATDAVVTAYIHEISPRHRPAEPTAEEAPPPHSGAYARCATPLS
jgi:hypothetical protein